MSDVSVQFRWDIPVLNRVVITPVIKRKVDKCVAEARARCPVGKTGFMRDSITGDVTGDPPVGRVTVGDPTYAKYIEKGTRPHDEYPVTAKAMVFTAKSGDFVITGHVRHPGNAANPFLTDAVRAVMGGGE